MIHIRRRLLPNQMLCSFGEKLEAAIHFGMKTKNVLELLVKMIIDSGCAWSLVDAGVCRLNLVVNPVRTVINGVSDTLQDLFRMGLAVTDLLGKNLGAMPTMVVVATSYTFPLRVYPPSARGTE